MMDNIDIEEEDLLFRTQRSLKLTRRKVIFGVVCFSCWCLITAGIGYIFYTVGKCDDSRHIHKVEAQNLYNNLTNGTQDDLLLFSKEESEYIFRMVEIFKNESRDAFQHLQETKDELKKFLQGSKNQSCNVLNITMEDEL